MSRSYIYMYEYVFSVDVNVLIDELKKKDFHSVLK